MSTLILQILQINAKSIPDVKVILNIFLYDLLIVFVILAKYIHQINFDMHSKKDGHILFLFHLHLYFFFEAKCNPQTQCCCFLLYFLIDDWGKCSLIVQIHYSCVVTHEKAYFYIIYSILCICIF